MSRLLPLELHRHILEFLWDPHTPDPSSYRTFASCAQTCSHWRAAARPFIFRFLIIRYEDQIAILENQIRKEPCIGNWVQNVRIEGSSLPYDDCSYGQLGTSEDLDGDLYSFPMAIDSKSPFPNLDVLELVGFAQISTDPADCSAFAEWIPRLTTLTSVTTLNIVRCEMSPNNLTSIIRSLPALKHVTIIADEMFHSNTSILRDVGGSATIINNDDDGRIDAPISYPLYHPPPTLHSISIDAASESSRFPIKFEAVADWLHLETLAKSLESLILGSNVTEAFTNTFLRSISLFSRLRHLEISTTYMMSECEYRVSLLYTLPVFDMSSPTSREDRRNPTCEPPICPPMWNER